MNEIVQHLIEEFAAIPVGAKTSTQRDAIVDQLARYGVYQSSGNWRHVDSNTDLGAVSPDGSVRAMSKSQPTSW